MKIRTQLGLSVIGVLAASFLATLLAVAWVLKGMVQEQLYQEQQAQVRMLGSVSEQALVLKDELFVLNYLRLLQALPGVQYAYMVDQESKTLVHTRPEFVYQPLERWKASGQEQGAVEWSSPVRLSGRRVGTVHIGFSRDHTQKTLHQAWNQVLYPIAGIALGGLLLGLLLSVVLAFYMTRPIQRLAACSQEVSRGNLSVSVPPGPDNELGELSRQFDYMTQQLRRLDELKADFIANVSHDLRSPMGAIIAYSNYLLSGEIGRLEEQQTKSIEVIRAQCHRLVNLVNNILDMGKIQAGKMEFLHEPFDLSQAARDIHQLFAITAKNGRISLRLDLPSGLRPAVGDGEKIHQVLTNLVSNAVKFTPQGGSITLGARPAGEMLEVFVRDTGPGIPPEELPRMFERFHQVDAEEQRAKKIHGTGLGLAISRGIVEGLGGKIWVESRQGHGTIFRFTLPCQDGRSGAAPRQEPRTEEAHGA